MKVGDKLLCIQKIFIIHQDGNTFNGLKNTVGKYYTVVSIDKYIKVSCDKPEYTIRLFPNDMITHFKISRKSKIEKILI